MDMLFEASSDIWLRLKLDSSVDTHVFDDLQRFLGVILHVFFRHLGWTFILRLVWLVKLLVLLDILNKLNGV